MAYFRQTSMNIIFYYILWFSGEGQFNSAALNNFKMVRMIQLKHTHA